MFASMEQKCSDMIGAVLVPFPIRKYKKKICKKNIWKQFYQTAALGICYSLKLPNCRLQFFFKFVASFIIIFRTLQWSFDLFQIRVLQRSVSSVFADAEDRYEMRLPASDGCRLRPMLR